MLAQYTIGTLSANQPEAIRMQKTHNLLEEIIEWKQQSGADDTSSPISSSAVLQAKNQTQDYRSNKGQELKKTNVAR